MEDVNKRISLKVTDILKFCFDILCFVVGKTRENQEIIAVFYGQQYCRVVRYMNLGISHTCVSGLCNLEWLLKSTKIYLPLSVLTYRMKPPPKKKNEANNKRHVTVVLTIVITIAIIISSLAIIRVKEETKGSGNWMASKSVRGIIDPQDSRECWSSSTPGDVHFSVLRGQGEDKKQGSWLGVRNGRL